MKSGLLRLNFFLLLSLFLFACGGGMSKQGYPNKSLEGLTYSPMMTKESIKTESPRDKKSLSANVSEEREANTEEYDKITENTFKNALENPFSTFAIDVDTASYSNTRRFIEQGNLPPAGAVRLEELVNYFTYEYPVPQGETPFSTYVEMSDCPWNTKNKLIHIGLQGRKVSSTNLPPQNLVFLLDVSGSMNAQNKLPLLKKALKLLIGQLRRSDRVTIVVYAGAAGMVLSPTPGNQQKKILNIFYNLQAGGSTAGGQGIKLAYKVAQDNFIKGGNNRVILATDGDFNVGASSDDALITLIEEKRKAGVFLTVLGFGMGNYKDSKMEKLADAGNGNYAYIDNLNEAKKVLVDEIGATLLTIAKDVKIQVEFNPAKIKTYRLLGYENRLLAKEDFDDDTKDAGELGAGHSVTALYEVELYAPGEKPATSSSKYTKTQIKSDAFPSDELLTLKLRYKNPDGEQSQLLSFPIKEKFVPFTKASNLFRFSAAVASYAMLLRQSKFIEKFSLSQTKKIAQESLGKDENGYRKEFLSMIDKTMALMPGSK